MRHKAEIAKDTADADVALKEALLAIKDSSASNVGELNKQLIVQSEVFKKILAEEKESFEKLNEELKGQFHQYISDNIASFAEFNKEMKSQFGSQIQQIPTLIKSLEPIANIPIQLDKLFNKIEQSNNSFSYEISQIMSKKLSRLNMYVIKKELRVILLEFFLLGLIGLL